MRLSLKKNTSSWSKSPHRIQIYSPFLSEMKFIIFHLNCMQKYNKFCAYEYTCSQSQKTICYVVFSRNPSSVVSISYPCRIWLIKVSYVSKKIYSFYSNFEKQLSEFPIGRVCIETSNFEANFWSPVPILSKFLLFELPEKFSTCILGNFLLRILELRAWACYLHIISLFCWWAY